MVFVFYMLPCSASIAPFFLSTSRVQYRNPKTLRIFLASVCSHSTVFVVTGCTSASWYSMVLAMCPSEYCCFLRSALQTSPCAVYHPEPFCFIVSPILQKHASSYFKPCRTSVRSRKSSGKVTDSDSVQSSSPRKLSARAPKVASAVTEKEEVVSVTPVKNGKRKSTVKASKRVVLSPKDLKERRQANPAKRRAAGGSRCCQRLGGFSPPKSVEPKGRKVQAKGQGKANVRSGRMSTGKLQAPTSEHEEQEDAGVVSVWEDSPRRSTLNPRATKFRQKDGVEQKLSPGDGTAIDWEATTFDPLPSVWHPPPSLLTTWARPQTSLAAPLTTPLVACELLFIPPGIRTLTLVAFAVITLWILSASGSAKANQPASRWHCIRRYPPSPSPIFDPAHRQLSPVWLYLLYLMYITDGGSDIVNYSQSTLRVTSRRRCAQILECYGQDEERTASASVDMACTLTP
ncbi:hypothetical protein IMY05_C4521000600 [Salix suchowensis]|nr:hypothetical protein IMY05_C4521000600 [Salix suchowensis]